MIPSSSSTLSAPGLRQPRPQSSLSQRPQSSLSQRPGSSLSTVRPHSSASVRPLSRVSQRPQSRVAKLNQARLLPLCHQLVQQTLGNVDDQGYDDEERDLELDRRRKIVDLVAERVDNITMTKAGTVMDLKVAEKTLSGHVQKARIQSRDEFAEALRASYQQCKSHLSKEHEFDQEITLSHLPHIMHLLFSLSNAPSPATLSYASLFLDKLKNPQMGEKPLTWETILADEPFEGQHWEGVYGLPPGAVKGLPSDDEEDEDDSPYMSPLHSDDLQLDDDQSSLSSIENNIPPPPEHALPGLRQQTYAHRKDVEDLQEKQYWRPDWHMSERFGVRFDIGDASVLGPTLQKILGRSQQNGLPAEILQLSDRYIYERDAVREILIALQGRKNIMLEWQQEDGHGFIVTKSTPKLRHFSLLSQHSILSSLGETATVVQKLRNIASSIITASHSPKKKLPSPRRITRTLQAFADAVSQEIRLFDFWCANREAEGVRALAGVPPLGGTNPNDDYDPDDPNPNNTKLVVSLLSTEKALRDTFSNSFGVLIEIISSVVGVLDASSEGEWMLPPTTPNRRTPPPSVSAAHLLDALFTSVQEHTEREDRVVANTMMRVFVTTAEPIWAMMGRWLKDGMGVDSSIGINVPATGGDELDEEFFIECNGLGSGGILGRMGLLDPDFWAEGYTLRDEIGEGGSARRRGVPAFLLHVAEPVLSCGKAVGLCKVLSVPLTTNTTSLRWRRFGELVADQARSDNHLSSSIQQSSDLFSVSVDTLSKIIYDELTPYSLATRRLLSDAITEQCELWQHLHATEDLFFMKRGDVITDFSNALFSKMDNNSQHQQSWTDYHFLNTVFSDTVQGSTGSEKKQTWIDLSLVRLSHRAHHHGSSSSKMRSVRALDGLMIEYAYPFPLTYIFTPHITQIYGEIFVFLLQIRRAKSLLEGPLRLRDDKRILGNDLKGLYALRSRLIWFINTLLNFLVTNVIHVRLQSFHQALRRASSLDQIISLHEEHLDRIQTRCLLKANTATLHRAVISALDLSIQFIDIFTTQTGNDTSLQEISRGSISRRHHRSRRQRRQRKNIIGFFDDRGSINESSSEDDDEERVHGDELPTVSQSFSFSAGDDLSHIDKISTELDGLVRFIRRGAEGLGVRAEEEETGTATTTFGILAFALEDWDL